MNKLTIVWQLLLYVEMLTCHSQHSAAESSVSFATLHVGVNTRGIVQLMGLIKPLVYSGTIDMGS